MKFLFSSIAEGSCLLNLEAQNMEDIVRASVDFLVQTGRLPESQRQTVIEGVLEREQLVPTVIGQPAPYRISITMRSANRRWYLFDSSVARIWAPLMGLRLVTSS